MTSRDSLREPLSAQQEKFEESGGGSGESEEEVQESEEGAEGIWVVEVTGGRDGGGGGGGWRGRQTNTGSKVKGVFKTIEPFDLASKGIRQQG